jgi:hypothetical protein
MSFSSQFDDSPAELEGNEAVVLETYDADDVSEE